MSARGRIGSLLMLASAAWALHGCSVIALSGIELPMCAANADCEPLNTDEGIALAACERYQCNHQNGRCEMAPRDHDDDGVVSAMCNGADCDDENPARKPGATEVCDGADDDCDGVVDDGAIGARGAGDAVTGVSGLARASYGPTGGASAGAVYGTASDDSTSLALLSGGAAATGVAHLVFGATGSDTELATDLQSGNCQFHSQTGTSLGQCHLNDAAAAPASDHAWFVAAINPLGCNKGQLRVGLFETASQMVEVRGPATRSNVYLGVDAQVASMQCTGASRASGVLGAARPAVAAMSPDQGANALVALLAQSENDANLAANACTPASAPATEVEALGLQLEAGFAGASMVEWLSGTGGGIPQGVGRTHSWAPPAVVAYPYSHYFMAWAGESGGVELRAVRAVTGATLDVVSAAPPALAPTAHVHRVALATGDVTAAGVGVGVAWDEGCSGDGMSNVWIARARFDTTRETFTAFEAPVQVSTSGAAHSPTLAFVRDGFVTASYPGGAAGGWVVAWVDGAGNGRRLLARRLLAPAGPLLDEPAIDLTLPGGQAAPDAPYLYAGDTATTLRFAYADVVRGAISGGDFLCAPRP